MFFSPCGRLTDDRNYPCAPQELNIQRSYFEGTPLFAYSASQINSYYGTQTWNEESNQLESTIRWTQTSRDSQGCVKKFDYSFTSQQFQQVHYGSCDSKFNDPCRYPSFGTQLSQAKSPDTGIPPKRRRRSRSSRKRFRSRQAAVEGFHGFYPLTASQPATEPCQHPAWAGRYFAAEFAATTCASTEVKPFLDNNNFSGGHSPWVTHDNSQNSSYLEPAMKIQGSFCKKDNMASDRRLSAGSPSRRDDPKIWKNVASASTSTWNAQRVGEDFSFPVDPTTFFGTRAHAATKTSFNEFSKDDRNLRHCNDKDSRVFNNLPEELSPHPPKSTSRRKRRHKSKVKKMREASVTVTGPVRILISNAFNKRPKKSRCVSEESGKTDVGLKTPLTSGLLSKQERRHSSHKVTRTPLTVKSEDVQESRRLSPSKSDFKPKALIKPGLRSAKKEKNKELQNIDKCDNLVGKQSVNGNENRKLVQKTLDSFFCKNLASEFRDNNLSIPNTIDSEKKCHLRLQSKSRSKNCRTTKHTHKYGSDNSNQSSDMKSHIRRIYQDEGQSSVPRLVVPVVHLRPLSESEVKNECSPVTQDATGGPALRANNTTRMALVAPIVSPFKQESCCSPTRDKGCDSPTLPPEKPVFGVGSPKRGSKKRNTLESPRPGTSPCKNSGSPPRKKILRETPDDTRGEVIAGLQSAGIARPRGSPPKRREGGEAELDLPVDNPVKPTEPEDAADALLDVEGHDDEYAQVQRDESAWRAAAASAAQRNKKRHSRGHKVYAYCQVLDEHIERHPVQNEVPEIKWSKWLNPTQLRCLTLAMLGNTEVCLNYTLDGEHNVEWEDFWIMVAKRLNSSCFNPLTKLNTGLRMTVDEWKKLWLELKARLKQRTESLTLEERHHRLGSLECLLLSEDLYKSLKESNGECLGEQCPRIWCPGACVGVVWGEPSSRRGTEEKG